MTTARAALEALASWTFFPALDISCLTSSGQPSKAGGTDVFILQRRKQRHREGASLARLTPQGRGPRGLGTGVRALHSGCPACTPSSPSAARVLPRRAAGALAIKAGPLGKMSIKRSGLLKKKTEILKVRGREDPQMRVQPGLYDLQIQMWQIQCQLVVNGRGAEG